MTLFDIKQKPLKILWRKVAKKWSIVTQSGNTQLLRHKDAQFLFRSLALIRFTDLKSRKVYEFRR